MKKIDGLYAAVALASAMVAMPAVAATPIVSGGKLIGATGVVVGGESYNVSFIDGTCSSIFGGCSSINFAFNTLSGAFSAGNALLSQVFVNSAAGAFDSRPEQIAGCSIRSVCNILIPFAQGGGLALVSDTVNTSSTAFDYNTKVLIGAHTSTKPLANYVYAKFTPLVTACVPEPGTWAMMLAGFGMMGAALRYRKRSTKLTYA